MTHPGEYFLLITSDHKLWRLSESMVSSAPKDSQVFDRFNWKKLSGVLPLWEVKIELFDYAGRLHVALQSLPIWS